jgi:hypothetical protein
MGYVALAELLGAEHHASTIGWCSGKVWPSVPFLQKIHEITGVTPDQMLQGYLLYKAGHRPQHTRGRRRQA